MILGLFFIRIFFDYGMVFDIVGKGIVKFDSLIVVLCMVCDMVMV